MKFKDYVGTEVMLGNLSNDLIEASKKGEVIDLAGCKLTPDFTEEILKLMKKRVIFIDSSDVDRNSLLSYNTKVVENILSEDNYYEAPPKYTSNIENLAEYLDLFKDDKCYNLSLLNTGDRFMFSIGFILSACRPEIKISYNEPDKPNFLKYTSSRIFVDSRQNIIDTTSRYFMLVENSVYQCNLPSKDLQKPMKIYPLKGLVTINDLISSNFLVPDYFGEVKLLESVHLKNIYATALVNVRKEIAAYMKNRKSLYNTLRQMQ